MASWYTEDPEDLMSKENLPFMLFARRMQEEDLKLGIKQELDDPSFIEIAYFGWKNISSSERDFFRHVIKTGNTNFDLKPEPLSSLPSESKLHATEPQLLTQKSNNSCQVSDSSFILSQPKHRQQPENMYQPQADNFQNESTLTQSSFQSESQSYQRKYQNQTQQRKFSSKLQYKPSFMSSRDGNRLQNETVLSQYPDLVDVSITQPRQRFRVKIIEPYHMIDNIPKDIAALTEKIGFEYLTFPFLIASSNVFVRNSHFCLPAEIGITKFSFKSGIEDKFHSLVNPGEIPVYEVPNVAEFAKEFHKILPDQCEFPDVKELIRSVHSFIHVSDSSSCSQPQAYIFVDVGELDQMSEVFGWFEQKSRELQLYLDWRLTFINLQTLFIFLRTRTPMMNPLDLSDSVVVFKTSKYYYANLCVFHDQKDCRHCAISKAHMFCYILSEYFYKFFGVQRIVPPQTAGRAWQHPSFNQ